MKLPLRAQKSRSYKRLYLMKERKSKGLPAIITDHIALESPLPLAHKAIELPPLTQAQEEE